MARVLGVSCHRYVPLETWEMARAEAGTVADPECLRSEPLTWVPAFAPGTVAAALRAVKLWEPGQDGRFDAHDWWFRCRFDASAPSAGSATFLRLEGLATVAEVWLNATLIMRSDNMFHQHAVDVSSHLRGENELLIRFCSLSTLLKQRRTRPRWRTRLVEHQQLRWFRTTLLGRIPAWPPAVDAVGPWRPVFLEERSVLSVEAADIQSRLEASTGIVRVAVDIKALNGRIPSHAFLRLGSAQAELALRNVGEDTLRIEGEIAVRDCLRWWPHTHGEQPLHDVGVAVRSHDHDINIDCGRVGFRTLGADEGDGGFSLRVNGEPIFCRGACWTTTDIVSLRGTPSAYSDALDLVRDAGMNMIRIGGTMHYEDQAFYDLCDERGILVWQDFMFASLDYPADDQAFHDSAQREAEEMVSRLQTSPCLAVLCGNTEVAQQAAMVGAPRDAWSNALFDRTLPEIARAKRPDVLYLSTTPSGGVLPFHVDKGISSYYGVGAYLRPLDDARRSNVRFAAECLAFSHVPEQDTIDAFLADGHFPGSDPLWKARVPRDSGTSWDFEDVRDHYLRLLFGADPVLLRKEDAVRYLALSRVVPGEVIASVLAEWRRDGSSCKGALLWLFRDLWPGPWWGIVDAAGTPKAAYYYARRVLQPVTIVSSDEGLNGLDLHVLNDTAKHVEVAVRLTLYRNAEVPVASAQKAVIVPGRGALVLRSDSLLDRFLDATCAYHFGPLGHDLVVASLSDEESGARLAECFHFPVGRSFPRMGDLGLEASAEEVDTATYSLTVRAKRFAQAVMVEARGYRPDDNYFHLEPGVARKVTLRRMGAARSFHGIVHPLNAPYATKIALTAALKHGFHR